MMNSMFYAYDNNIDITSFCGVPFNFEEPQGNTKMLYNKAGKFIGVQAKYKVPFSLYFNLHAICSRPDLIEFIAGSMITLKINNVFHKPVLEKTMAGYEILDPQTGDLCIFLDSLDVSKLLQESYRLELSLLNEGDSYLLFNEFDTYLVIR